MLSDYLMLPDYLKPQRDAWMVAWLNSGQRPRCKRVKSPFWPKESTIHGHKFLTMKRGKFATKGWDYSNKGTPVPLWTLYGMKIGGGFYRDGERLGKVVYVSAFAMRDSQNPQFLTTDKAMQFSIIIDVRLPGAAGLTAHTWEIGDEHNKRRVQIKISHHEERRTVMVVEVMP